MDQTLMICWYFNYVCKPIRGTKRGGTVFSQPFLLRPTLTPPPQSEKYDMMVLENEVSEQTAALGGLN